MPGSRSGFLWPYSFFHTCLTDIPQFTRDARLPKDSTEPVRKLTGVIHQGLEVLRPMHFLPSLPSSAGPLQEMKIQSGFPIMLLSFQMAGGQL